MILYIYSPVAWVGKHPTFFPGAGDQRTGSQPRAGHGGSGWVQRCFPQKF